ncbi:glycosyltransferase family 48 protein [Paxillus involutus ATCC 200175]|nr:glycosyltransferase family 48 protein [Paxillus involutus ATCC 200175]
MPKQIYANLLVIAEVEPKYLIQLHPVEDNFIKDARIHAEETDHMDATSSMNEKLASTKTDALPLYCVDFKASSPEHLPHTYLGLTSCSDALPYRSGMMNYSKIELPGNSIFLVRDNQDHAIVFCGGEYPQPIDALRGVRRFVISLENSRNTLFLVKARARNGDTRSSRKLQWLSPVHIPSENIGFFGRYYYWERTDLRYHDGWRGSVSKAHNGLHLDEDIFAGMKAFRRGGRIQDSEDCRAARAATLTKIGAGTGEQMLSGTTLACSSSYIGTLDKQLAISQVTYKRQAFVCLKAKLEGPRSKS